MTETALLLPYGELAVALYASSMPTSDIVPHAVSLDLVDGWVRHGIAVLGGGEEVARMAQRSRELGLRRARGTMTNAEAAEYATLWPAEDRSNIACAVAYHVILARRMTTHPTTS